MKGRDAPVHVFLTGPVQVGKSTTIARFLARRNIAPGGFQTRWTPEGVLELRLLESGDVFAAARRGAGRVQADPAAFDAAGRRLLELGAGAPLLLMDELGFLEGDAADFRRAVWTLLDAGTPVLGVLRDHPANGFRPGLEHRSDTAILTVSEANRAEIPRAIAARLGL